MSVILLLNIVVGFPEGSRRDEVVRFLEASTLMKGIKHQHILSVLRVSVEDNYVPLVIYPMVEHCDMYRVIRLASDPEHSVLPVSPCLKHYPQSLYTLNTKFMGSVSAEQWSKFTL